MKIQRTQLQPIQDILTEREAQDARWGLPEHCPFVWQTILAEEIGEYAKAALELRYNDSLNPEQLVAQKHKLRHELVQIAAVALAAVECCDRGLWAWPSELTIVHD